MRTICLDRSEPPLYLKGMASQHTYHHTGRYCQSAKKANSRGGGQCQYPLISGIHGVKSAARFAVTTCDQPQVTQPMQVQHQQAWHGPFQPWGDHERLYLKWDFKLSIFIITMFYVAIKAFLNTCSESLFFSALRGNIMRGWGTS